MGLRPTQTVENLWVFDRAGSVSSHKFGCSRYTWAVAVLTRRGTMGSPSARAGDHVCEKSAGCFGFDQGDGCPDFQTRCLFHRYYLL